MSGQDERAVVCFIFPPHNTGPVQSRAEELKYEGRTGEEAMVESGRSGCVCRRDAKYLLLSPVVLLTAHY